MNKEVKQEDVQEVAQATVPVYSAAELAESAARLFGASEDIATAALRVAGIQAATIEQAENIIKKFAKKEVK